MFERIGEGRWFRRFIAAAAGVGPLLAQPAAAAEPPVAKEPVRIWYRSSEGCPDGAAFIDLLSRLGRAGSLASVGDRVDFVVTVAYAPGQSSGHLERQSSDRTVAIRDAAAASCSEVAEVLALSIDLAVEPPSGAAPGVMEHPTSSDSSWESRIGAQGTLTTGVARTVLFGAAAFIEVRPPAQPWELRLSALGGLGKRDATVALSLGLLASRFEACSIWEMGQFVFGPCAGIEVGWLHAEGSGAGARDDDGVWSAAVLHARGGWQLGPVVALEAQVGLVAPFVRYRFDALTGGEVAGSAALGLEAALGLSFRL